MPTSSDSIAQNAYTVLVSTANLQLLQQLRDKDAEIEHLKQELRSKEAENQELSEKLRREKEDKEYYETQLGIVQERCEVLQELNSKWQQFLESKKRVIERKIRDLSGPKMPGEDDESEEDKSSKMSKEKAKKRKTEAK